jgi:hypothetical protein
MKKLSSLLLLIFSVTTSLLAQDPTAADCKQFRTGTFYVKNMPNIVITRDGQFQTETDPATGKYVKMSITWTSDCTYELRLVKSTMRSEKKAWKKLKVLTVTITSVDVEENSYRFSASSPAMMEPVKGTIVKKK